MTVEKKQLQIREQILTGALSSSGAVSYTRNCSIQQSKKQGKHKEELTINEMSHLSQIKFSFVYVSVPLIDPNRVMS